MTPSFRPADARRLAFIKFVVGLGRDYSRAAEPNCAVSLLQLHDGIELLLQFAGEKLNVRVERNTPFLGYWPLLSEALGESLPLHGAMKRLNEARVGLKHHGHLPGRAELSDFDEITAEFVRIVTPRVFGLSWDDVSQADFVRSLRAREILKDAEQAFARRDCETCVVECKKAFETLMTEYSPFREPDRLPALQRSWYWRVPGEEPTSEFHEFAEWVTMELYRLRTDLETVATGLDPRRVARFSALTPMVAHSANWKWHVLRDMWKVTPDESDATFCLEFVLDAAAKIEARPILTEPEA